MPEVADVSAIARQVRARIKQIEDQLKQHERLTDELDRLRDALTGLEGAARSRVSTGRAPAARPAGKSKREIAKATGIGSGTVSTMLTKMAKSGELAKAQRGYTLAQ